LRLLQKFTVILAISTGVVASGCVRKVTMPSDLKAQPPVPIEKLVERINSYEKISSFTAQTDIYVFDHLIGEDGMANKYGANGALVFARPDKIRIKVTAPVVNSGVADMTSDAEQFRLAVYWPKEDRMFIHGTNLNEIRLMNADDIKDAKDPRLKQAGALANIRPQHITDAFIIKPIPLDGRLVEYFKEEDKEVEPNPKPTRKSRMITRTYDVLYVLQREEGNGRLHVRRKFWFDRTREGVPLVRQQTFENGDGKLGSDVVYDDFFAVPNTGLAMARSVKISRPNDGYDIWLVLNQDSVEVNPELPDTAFVLENREHMKDMDLDRPGKDSIPAELRERARSNHQ
jgi:hypothetical protein